jgi:hypothetical protein
MEVEVDLLQNGHAMITHPDVAQGGAAFPTGMGGDPVMGGNLLGKIPLSQGISP